MNSIEEIEDIYKKIPLDIEFIITKNLDIYILQVRPLLLAKKNSLYQDKKINRCLNSLKKDFNKNEKLEYRLWSNARLESS